MSLYVIINQMTYPIGEFELTGRLLIDRQKNPDNKHPFLADGTIFLPWYYTHECRIGSPHAAIEPISETAASYTPLFLPKKRNGNFAIERYTQRNWKRLWMKTEQARKISLPLNEPLVLRTDQSESITVNIADFYLYLFNKPIMEGYWKEFK